MVGYVRWEEKRKKLTLRRCPLGDGEVCLLEGGGRLNRRVQRRVPQGSLQLLLPPAQLRRQISHPPGQQIRRLRNGSVGPGGPQHHTGL